MLDDLTTGPLAAILPTPADRRPWRCADTAVAADTGETVLHYEHQHTGRRLRLDRHGRVYGQDAEGVVRLFGRGGALALAVALNAVYDGFDELRPAEVAVGDVLQRG